MRTKSTLVIMVLTVLAIGSQAWAGYQGIDMLYEWHEVGVAWYERISPYGPGDYIYHEFSLEQNGPIPVSNRHGAVVGSGVFMVMAGGQGGGHAPSAGAGASYRFSPWADTPIFEFVLHMEVDMIPSSARFQFTDITTGEALLDLYGDSWTHEWIETNYRWHKTYSFDVDPSHVYEMLFGAGGDGGALVELTWLQPHVVPIPGAILLGIVGTGMIGWMRRRGRL